MIPTAIVASLGFGSGAWATVRSLKRNGNGHTTNGGSPDEPRPLKDVPNWVLERDLAFKSVVEDSMKLLSRRVQEAIDRLADRARDPVAPDAAWVAALETRFAAHTAALVESKEAGWTHGAVSLLERVVERLNAIEDRLCALLEMGPAPLLEPGERVELVTLIRTMCQLPGEIDESIRELSKQQEQSERKLLTAVKSSGGGSPPPRRDPPPARAARAIPNPLPPIPHIPPSYFGGTVMLAGGSPENLLLLIQQQLQPNCPGSGVQLRLTADAEVFVGSASFLGGPLSSTNYAFVLEAGQERLYRSAYPGSSVPLGDLQVLGSGALHVELQL